jgi:murein DD-endopeptidase MepM/ murein hydrolase activator NlpD
MKKLVFTFAGLVVTVLLAVFLVSQSPNGGVSTAQEIPQTTELAPSGGGEFKLLPKDEITEEQRQEIKQRIQENIAKLEREGKLASASSQTVPLSWPVRAAPGNTDFAVDAISNYVDQNPAFPNQLRDYSCGTRTYDLASGYNHAGVDIFTWPFSWNKMDNNEVEVVAAAPGTIVFKSDGNFDRNCGFGSGNWNAVYVRHSDNSVAWYGHLKNGSVTNKAVGQTVATGERLGVIGSSGNSTGPHLHFELYNGANQLQDPYQGACNTINNFSWWAVQEPYRNSRINKLMTHSAAPVFQTCPNPEITNEKNAFRPGEQLIVASYYRDQVTGQQSQLSIIAPNGVVASNWVHNSPDTYPASYWYWTLTIPANATSGVYKFRVSYNSQTYEKTFLVSRSTPFDFDGDGRSDVSVFRQSNADWYIQQSTQGFTGARFGLGSDKLAPADFDGDGKTDIAVFRDGNWYLLRSQLGFASIPFGAAGDVPVPADYDGDGKADVAVFRNGFWYLLNSSNNSFRSVQFGQTGDKAIAADYDGDGKTDVGVFRAGNWFHLRSSDGQFRGVAFGLATDKTVVGDYDGDGRADQAVYRDGNWYLNRSTLGFASIPFGINTDIPAAADFDGDGRTDPTVFRNGIWYSLRSTQGFSAFQFGAGTDQPIPAVFGQ